MDTKDRGNFAVGSVVVFDEMSDYQYVNIMMSPYYNPTKTLQLPDAFVNATERWIIIRECWASVQNGHLPIGIPADDVLLYGSWVDDPQSHNYVCLCNSSNSKKKRFRVRFKDQQIRIWFKNIDGLNIEPSQYIVDMLLKFK
jgi:hypothetical protein